jgi:CHAD domain-containing protein
VPVTWYDTFDWRLYRDGGTLSARPENDGWILIWSLLEGGIRHRLRVEKLPAFASDLPSGPFRDALAPVIAMRRILPLVRTEFLRESLRVLDIDNRDVARIDLEEGMASAPDDEEIQSPVPPRILLQPRDDHPEDFGRVVAFVETELGLHPDRSERLRLALAAIGREPASYTSKINLPLDRNTGSRQATLTILRTLLNTIRVNEEGVRRGLDTEFLHDFRVAVRRTRTCLAQLKRVFPEELFQHYRREFAWLGSITGPTRDLDVYLLKMPDYRALLPARARADLEPLTRFLDRRQSEEQSRLVEHLASVRYRALLHFWTRFLNERATGHADGPDARRPIFEVATERIARCWKRTIRLGKGIDGGAPVKTMHRLRIECKKLRYLLEFFRNLYNPDDLQPMIEQLKKLQDSLGDFNDLQIQRDGLNRIAGEMYEERAATAETFLAMGRLVEQLEDRQERERHRFRQRFAKFSGRPNRERMRRLRTDGGS